LLSLEADFFLTLLKKYAINQFNMISLKAKSAVKNSPNQLYSKIQLGQFDTSESLISGQNLTKPVQIKTSWRSKDTLSLKWLELKIDTKVLITKIKQKLENFFSVLQVSTKFYLFILVFGGVWGLSVINLQAYNQSRANLFIKSETLVTNISYTPAIYTPNLNAGDYKDYVVYTIKNDENGKLETLKNIAERFAVSVSSLTANNNTELKVGSKIVIPKANGYLLGYNDSYTNSKLAYIASLVEQDIAKVRSMGDGYILIAGDDLEAIKARINDRLVRFEYKERFGVDLNGDFRLITSGKSNFGPEVNAFYEQYKGRRHPDPNGYSHGECVSLSKRWQVFIGAAFDIWPGYNGSPGLAFDNYLAGNRAIAPDNNKFKTVAIINPNDIQAGDIITTQFNGSFSHTGIATGKVSNNFIEVVEQNNPAYYGVTQIGNVNKSIYRGHIRYIKN
jgi:hypothetical protein